MSVVALRRGSKPKAKPSQVEKASWQEYVVRFAFGGLVTAAVGVIGTAFGPVFAGLFLAFPAILPASLTLVAQHYGEPAAGREALGACAGAVGLVFFGLMIWQLPSLLPGAAVLVCALAGWTIVALTTWLVLKTLFPRVARG